MSGGVVYWYDLVTLKRKGGGHEHDHDQRGVVVHIPDNKRGMRRRQRHHVRGRRWPPHCRQEHLLLRRHRRVGLGHQWPDRVVTGVSRALDLVRFDDDGRTTPAAGRRVAAIGVALTRRRARLGQLRHVLAVAWQGHRGVPPCGHGVRRRRTLHAHRGKA